ncbi:hypothetical protein, partial [Paraburkholderia sp. SIMBA_054]|uniref:hypothetical protein n=1 Tax=Paraburkholderia sp. SIMBA_054 TaxID=3085795 RepID=UPI0039786463
MSNNGIFNNEEKALANGAKQHGDEANAAGVYYILNPETGSPIAEMLYAGYSKLNGLLKGRLPLSGAERANIDIAKIATDEGAL